MMITRARKALALTATALLVVAPLTACGGGGSDESFCDVVLDDNLEDLDPTVDPQAFADAMSRLANSAPSDLQSDISLLRDVFGNITDWNDSNAILEALGDTDMETFLTASSNLEDAMMQCTN